MSEMSLSFCNYYDQVIVICSLVSVQHAPRKDAAGAMKSTTSEYSHTARNRLSCYPYPIRKALALLQGSLSNKLIFILLDEKESKIGNQHFFLSGY